MSRSVFNRRHFLCAGMGGLLAACADNQLGPIASTVHWAVLGADSPDITQEKVNHIPYASLSAKIGLGPKSFLVLGKIDGNDLSWYSADRNVFIIRHGRLIKTAGLPKNLAFTRFPGEDFLPWNAQKNGRKFQRLIGLDPTMDYDVPVDVLAREMGRGKIHILEKSYDTLLVREKCVASRLDWHFENHYWIDIKTKNVVKSRQFFHPDLPYIETELLKPPSL